MIEIKPPNFYNQKELEDYFVQLIVFSSTPYEAFKEFCKYESDKYIQEIAKNTINSNYLRIKHKYGTPLYKELL